MYQQGYQIVLFVVQIINFLVTLLFLSLFSRQLHYLGTYSTTDKYKDHFPYPRVVFSLLYVALSIALIAYNLIENTYGGIWYDYILKGGGGECINSIVMIIQLLVLRLQLRKERAYTKLHVYYFIYLAIISLVRLIFTLISQGIWTLNLANLIITVLMLADSIIQLAYWMIKKHYLPRFENPINAGTNLLSFPSRQAINRLDLTERSGWKTNDDKFPYIFPVVSIELGKIRIILQIPSHGIELQQQPMSPASSRPNDTTFLSPFLRPSFSVQSSSSPQQICVSFYTVEQIQQLYINCGRLPLSHKLEFDGIALCDMVKPLQVYLQQLLRQKKWYHPSILRQLKVPQQFINHYKELIEHVSNANNKQTEMNQIGEYQLDDKNAIYCSVVFQRYLWVSDHYEFYFKTVLQSTGQSGQTHKRFTQFEDHYSSLKQNIKNLNLPIELPPLPKRHHVIHRHGDNDTKQRKTALQGYLKKLTNDCTIMTVPILRQSILQFLGLDSELSIEGRFETEYYHGIQLYKGEITKKIINNDCVTYYEFGLFKNGMEIKSISKRFSEIEELHRELQRWMNNIQITYQIIVLPERVYYKSQALRHEKMMHYLQNVVAIRDIGMVYAVNRFFNIRGEQTDSESQISAIAKKRRKGSYATPIIEMSPLQRRMSNESSGRFSKQMNDLGNQDLD